VELFNGYSQKKNYRPQICICKDVCSGSYVNVFEHKEKIKYVILTNSCQGLADSAEKLAGNNTK
jgi:hypothetical protein